MPRPIVQQQEKYHPEANELLIKRTQAAVSDKIAQKRWEFQNTDIDPNRLWNLANQVEVLNWVSYKLNRILRQYKQVPNSSVQSLIATLIKVLIRIEKSLLKFETDSKKSYEYYRLKSRATIIEWSLFQIHFIADSISG
jgi:hypothetical protein